MKASLLRKASLWLTFSLLAACGSPEPGESTTTVPIKVSKPSVAAETQNPLANMVKAVSTSSGQQPVGLQFELAARPEVGKPLAVKLNLLGLADATGVQLTVTGGPALEILDGGQVNFPSLKVGESLSHSLSLRGTGAGIFVADVQLTATIDGTLRTLNYAIPIAVTLPEPAGAASASASGMAAGG